MGTENFYLRKGDVEVQQILERMPENEKSKLIVDCILLHYKEAIQANINQKKAEIKLLQNILNSIRSKEALALEQAKEAERLKEEARIKEETDEKIKAENRLKCGRTLIEQAKQETDEEKAIMLYVRAYRAGVSLNEIKPQISEIIFSKVLTKIRRPYA